MEPVEVFISFHQEDEKLFQDLLRQLAGLRREKLISCWHSREIVAGDERIAEIDKHLNQAGIILLLISPNFIDSDSHWTVDVTRALERNESGKARTILVLLRYTDWEIKPIDRLPLLPRNRIPIKKWEDQDEAFLEVVSGIREELQSLTISRANSLVPEPMADEKLQDRITILINEGDRLHEQNSLEESASKYRSALSLDSSNVLAHHNLGVVLAEQNNLEEAIVELEHVITLNPNDADTYYNLGNIYKKLGNLEKAVAKYQKAITLDQNNADIYCNLGNVLGILEKLDEAISACKMSLSIDARNATAHSNMGTVLKKIGKAQEAISHYRRAVELDPKNAKMHYNLAFILDEQGRLEEATLEYKKAIHYDSSYAKACYGLGNVLYKQGETDKAILQYRKATKIDPNNADAHHQLGFLLDEQGRKGAIAAFKRAVNIEPDNISFKKSLNIAMARKRRS